MDKKRSLSSCVRLVAWAYLASLFHLTIQGIRIPPEWVHWLLVFLAIRGLKEELPKIALLEVFAIAWGLWSLVNDLPILEELPLGAVTLAFTLMGIYFKYQLFSDLAQLAARYALAVGEDHSGGLLTARNAMVVLTAALQLVGHFVLGGLQEFESLAAIAFLILNFGVYIYAVVKLFKLAGGLKRMEENMAQFE